MTKKHHSFTRSVTIIRVSSMLYAYELVLSEINKKKKHINTHTFRFQKFLSILRINFVKGNLCVFSVFFFRRLDWKSRIFVLMSYTTASQRIPKQTALLYHETPFFFSFKTIIVTLWDFYQSITDLEVVSKASCVWFELTWLAFVCFAFNLNDPV